MKQATNALKHIKITALGFLEFRGSCGMTYENDAKSEAYDYGRDLAHRLTLRLWDECR